MKSTSRPRPSTTHPWSQSWGLRLLIAGVLILAAFVMAGCDVHGISDPGTLTSITVTPNATLTASSTQQMIAVGHDADGRTIDINPVWSVAAGGGTISTSGVFAAGTVPGFFANTAKASVGGISGTASITVTVGPLASITVVPNPVTLAVTATQTFTAIGKDASGNIVQFTPTWSVVAGGGTITQAGLFTAGGAPGTYTNTVQASNNGLTGSATVIVTVGPLATITVTPNPSTLVVGAQQQFTATGKDASGNAIVIAAVWSVVANGGTISSAGLFTAGPTPGTYTNTVKATSGSLSGTATVIVTAGPLATITVLPNPATMAINGTQQFTATGSDVGGNPVAITPVWSVVAGGGTITATGLFTAGTLSGTFTNTVRATSGGMFGSATVIVTSGPLATIIVTPNPVFMPTNSTQQFVAVGRDASNNVFIITPVWSVVNFGGTISNTGLFTSGNVAGTYLNTVQATSGTISGTATVTVNAPAPPPPPPPPPSPLASAANFGILAGAAISCGTPGNPGSVTGLSSVANLGTTNNTYTGFVGIPVAGSCLHDGGVMSAAQIATAQNDLTAHYNTVKLAPGACALIAPFPAGNNLSGLDLGSVALLNLPPGNYCFAAGAQLTGNLILSGPAAAVWNFSMESTLTTAVGSNMSIIGGGIADNVYWAVGSSATLAGTNFLGNVMAQSAVTLNANTTLNGRALARTAAVDMTAGGARIIKP